MTIAAVADGLCRYFGGAYDPNTHSYRLPQITVPNMGGPILRRAFPKDDDQEGDYFTTSPAPPGLPIGCMIAVLLDEGTERRVAEAGAFSGVKQVRHSVKMHCFLVCQVAYAEDAQDASYALIDAIRAFIEADRTCGTGGFENGGFQVAEGGEPWMRWKISPIMTVANEHSKGYALVEFAADQYIQA